MNNITLVKIPGLINKLDLEHWRKRFVNNLVTVDEMKQAGIVLEEIKINNDDNNYITLVKVGNDEYKPTPMDLENWQKIFEEAERDPDFKIFTHDAVTIERVKIENDSIIITGDCCVIRPSNI